MSRILASVLLTWLAMGAPAAAGDIAPLAWRSIGPFRGGRVLAVEADPRRPLRFYFGAVNGGVWRTDDAGRTWRPIFDSAPVGSIGALALAPSNPDVLYVGTGEADMRSDIAVGAGMFKSLDGGTSFTPIGLSDTQAIGRILVDPGDPDVVLVAALGHPYGPNSERGVFRSVDGGKSWTRTLFKDENTGAIDLAYRPGDPKIIYAALWQTRRPPWNVYPPSSGPGGGLYKSVDGGASWKELGGGFPAAAGRIGLAVSPARPDTVWALADGKEAGLWRSDDQGARWTKINGDPRIVSRAWYFQDLTVDPKNPDTIFVCDTVIYRSDDGGKSFRPVKGDPTGDDFHTLVIDPARPERRILGVDQGALVTLDGGASWSSWYNQPTGQFYHVATDGRFPYWVYGAQQDSGAAAVPSRTEGVDGIEMTHFREIVPGGESDSIAPDPDDPHTVYGGRVEKLDTRTGQTRNVDPTLALPDLWRGTWTLPLVFSKTRPHLLYFANQRIFETGDGGRHWRPISPDLTREAPGAPANLDPATAADDAHGGPRRGVVYAIGPSPLDPKLIWAGTDDGLVWRTTDGGGHWTDVTPKALSPWSKVGSVEASHFDRDTAYLAVDRHRLDDFKAHVFVTHDGGAIWREAGAGIASASGLDAVNVVREDPVRRGLLYVGAESGVFVSSDDGGRWRSLRGGLPPTSVRDIDVHGDDLVIATHGRGFYIMDDITPLRVIDPGEATRDGLLPPARAIRYRPVPFSGTPLPKDEPMAPNPPAGAYIDYELARTPAGPVTLTIRDARGGVVRSYSSANPLPPSPRAASVAPEWLPAPPTVAVGAGLHRFVWDERYAPMSGKGAGVWAPPGRYTVVLDTAGKTFSQPLDLAPDPRVKASRADYAAEFALARRIGALQARLTAVFKAPPDSPLAPPEAVGSLPEISHRLTALMSAVDGADGPPSPDAIAGVTRAEKDLEAALVHRTPAHP
ncbi:MAG: WD40/YVTN/BNR-like repeat-containing protein [Caulobacteraceae bacterium]